VLRTLVVMTAILFVISCSIGVYSYVANGNRVSDIQTNRLSSCIRTYDSFDQVFRPLFPPNPRTPVERRQLHKFEATINRLKRSCREQVSTSSVGDPRSPRRTR
jgi:hypothetical protein